MPAGSASPASSEETSAAALDFLDACQRFYADYAITIERVLTENGKCFKRRWQEGCEAGGIKVKRTRPYRPQTNGKVERFIRTLLESWAYSRSDADGRERAAALAPTLATYNHARPHRDARPHRALGGLTPLQRVNNLSGTNS